jgi:hypothetical protein
MTCSLTCRQTVQMDHGQQANYGAAMCLPWWFLIHGLQLHNWFAAINAPPAFQMFHHTFNNRQHMEMEVPPLWCHRWFPCM